MRGIERRYPYLIRAMQWCAILSTGEAASAIRDYQEGFYGAGYGCEAVAHYGGPLAVIRGAIRVRHTVSQWHRKAQTCSVGTRWGPAPEAKHLPHGY